MRAVAKNALAAAGGDWGMHRTCIGGLLETCIGELYRRIVLKNCIGEFHGGKLFEKLCGVLLGQSLRPSISCWVAHKYWRIRLSEKNMCCQKAQAKKHLTNSIPHRLTGTLHAVFNCFLTFGVYLFQLKPWKGNLRDQEKNKGQAPGRESKLLMPEIQQGLHPANWLPSSSKIGLGAEYQFSMPRSLPTRLLQICNLLNAT